MHFVCELKSLKALEVLVAARAIAQDAEGRSKIPEVYKIHVKTDMDTYLK